ncbi:MAG TPA: hypothetical protein VFO10_22300 [Oligoflexus sp.]|uniref:hypothetical protein n=1 Tax=Oligoflexus sp. TaxID=1971216 RepID=UPI002D7F9151|nr:hypothetical protein [Oligoflexus sp.]HET9240010.1 hypothetical protein [Oligoflexus sp.]
MRFPAFTLILLVCSGCSSGIFDAKESTTGKIAGTEAAGNADTSDSGRTVDQAARGTGKDARDGKASSSPTASVDGAASGTAAERAAAIARACPQVDPKVIEQLIASGQPFEVECEVEIEVGPDNE